MPWKISVYKAMGDGVACLFGCLFACLPACLPVCLCVCHCLLVGCLVGSWLRVVVVVTVVDEDGAVTYRHGRRVFLVSVDKSLACCVWGSLPLRLHADFGSDMWNLAIGELDTLGEEVEAQASGPHLVVLPASFAFPTRKRENRPVRASRFIAKIWHAQVQDILAEITGARTVPRVFIGGQCIGGGGCGFAAPAPFCGTARTCVFGENVAKKTRES